MNVLILAAGRGVRMRSALPKVLHPLAGRPLLRHAIDTARALGPQKICIVYGYGGETVPRAIAGEDLFFVKQEPQLGTGHALMQAMPALADSPASATLVLYGDVPLIGRETLTRMLANGDQGLTLLTVSLDDPTGYGRIVRDERNAVRAIVEQKDANEAQRQINEINTGIMLIPTSRLPGWLAKLTTGNAQGEYYLTDIVALAIADGVAVATVQPARSWEALGVNSKAQLVSLERIYQRNVAEGLLEAGVTLADAARIDVRGGLHCGADVFIDINCVFEGDVTLEDGVRIGANCVLRNSTVGARSNLKPFSLIEDAEIGTDCSIGPFARLRPGTTMGVGAKIGNFVETKKTVIGDGSKINHLSYVGDTDIGRNVNIGAGTITCNYDGANKHRTVIEDDAFIGSDTQLVAPVKVGRGATLGAGTTLTADAPAGELTISRARQTTIAGWKRPKKKI
ncbi:MAG: bifunctional UDP-N-acetylglucosamine diphosphorylase/glucosamine-1-phosphate N-acetyltransferase GlmU [Burkholderiales bacterium]|nr:bifunctional UDP-N-acetylglucosamine diphosphorylase/glucosamine-1-phosphate N-acetyltransferase GlmU [Burkholderiales bacterium]